MTLSCNRANLPNGGFRGKCLTAYFFVYLFMQSDKSVPEEAWIFWIPQMSHSVMKCVFGVVQHALRLVG